MAFDFATECDSGKSSDAVGDFGTSDCDVVLFEIARPGVPTDGDLRSTGLGSFALRINSGVDSTFELASGFESVGFIKVLLVAISLFELDLASCEFRITKRQRARINSPTTMLYGRLFPLFDGAGFKLAGGSPAVGEIVPVADSGLVVCVALLVLVLELAIPPTIFGWTFFNENRTGTDPTPTPCG